MNWLIFLGLATASFGLVVATSLALANRGTHRIVFALVLTGLLASALKIWLFQQTPQWHEVIPDSVTYHLNAQAFAAHWNGESVNGIDHNLRGLLAMGNRGLNKHEWSPNDHLSYASIMGSHEWLYAAYIAIWYFFCNATPEAVIASNALWAAFLPAAAFGIAINLGAKRYIAVAAAGLALADPSAGANASWLLKDTIAAFLTMATLWSLISYLKNNKGCHLFIASLALSGLGGIRFGAFAGMVISIALICSWLLIKKQKKQALMLACTALFAWTIQGVYSQAPHIQVTSHTPGTSIKNNGGTTKNPKASSNAVFRTFMGGTDVLTASEGETAADESVISWKNHLFEQPIHAIFRSLARTLFAPYPWVAIDPGLNWRSSSELYYPGTILWIICLPGILTFISTTARKSDPATWLLLLFLASQFAAYTIWLGEWSTRQRVFTLAAFFAIAMIGWVQLRDIGRSRLTNTR